MHDAEGAKAKLERPNVEDNRARATAPSNGRRTQLRALRFIRLFGAVAGSLEHRIYILAEDNRTTVDSDPR